MPNIRINPIFSLFHISDTHGRHRQLPELPTADVIVHSGDITEDGTEEEVFDFINWFCDLPQFKHKIFIAGNHDTALYGCDQIEGLDENCHYLCNSSVDVDGLRFYGMPDFVQDHLDGINATNIARIPQDVDVLITHEPPYGIADEYGGHHFGSELLLHQVLEVSPRYHLFGHVHKQYPIIEGGRTTFSNGVISTKVKPEKLKIINTAPTLDFDHLNA